ncbi:unnamed protein product [Durusdinium trenchii]|uniref:Uncharacterized protein n=1 Tax=Durusdinium trenchii TaxID=1381693 RepID=A0ABP0QHG6_9DINO
MLQKAWTGRPGPNMLGTAPRRSGLLLTDEILDSIQYEDKAALNILREGSTLAGRIESCCILEQQFKPCLMTLDQLEGGAKRRNQAILAMTCSCGDEAFWTDRYWLRPGLSLRNNGPEDLLN